VASPGQNRQRRFCAGLEQGILKPLRLAHGYESIRVTVLESLAQGVPQVAIPVTFDQPGVAARIAHKQTGVVTSLDNLNADHLAFLVDQVLTDSTYRENARTLQKAIAQANGLSVAADLIEESLGVIKGY
jgi:UDP:flavonoid glycosyltransferase YjiC (YdhE family)